MITRKMAERSTARFQEQKKSFESVGSFMGELGNLGDAPVKAEFDTWSWYYSELSNLRIECSRLGLLVRLRNHESWQYLRAYHAHIYSFIQLVTTVLPYDLSEKIREKWKLASQQIDTWFQEVDLLQVKANNYPIPDEIIYKLDMLYDIALKIAQEVGLGFKTTISTNTVNSLERSIMGE